MTRTLNVGRWTLFPGRVVPFIKLFSYIEVTACKPLVNCLYASATQTETAPQDVDMSCTWFHKPSIWKACVAPCLPESDRPYWRIRSKWIPILPSATPLQRLRAIKLSHCAVVFHCFTWVTKATGKWNHRGLVALIHGSCLTSSLCFVF